MNGKRVWYVIEVATLRALVRAGDQTSGDARSGYMISEDANSWNLSFVSVEGELTIASEGELAIFIQGELAIFQYKENYQFSSQVIPLGQKNTLAEYMILSGADNRPPMLDKDLYDS
ncbi:hypothetical protein Tco_0868098 [Tanacetum coccineum]